MPKMIPLYARATLAYQGMAAVAEASYHNVIDGVDGKPGKDGKDGKPDVDGKNGLTLRS